MNRKREACFPFFIFIIFLSLFIIFMNKMLNSKRPFHLAFPVYDLKKTEKWYKDILSCKIGRRSDKWIDFDFFGHQISAHLIDVTNKVNMIKNNMLLNI